MSGRRTSGVPAAVHSVKREWAKGVGTCLVVRSHHVGQDGRCGRAEGDELGHRSIDWRTGGTSGCGCMCVRRARDKNKGDQGGKRELGLQTNQEHTRRERSEGQEEE